MLRFGCLILLVGICRSSIAQETEVLWEPQLSYTWKQSEQITLITRFTARQSMNNYDNLSFVRFIQPSVSMIFNASPRMKVGLGYNYRYRQPSLSEHLYEHRLSQQLGFISFIGDKRFSHRIRFEQRIRSEAFQHRYRYRITYDFPLTGTQLDSGEKYLILKNEVVNALSKSDLEIENRFTVGLGWYYTPKRKFEVGTEYRTQGLGPDPDIQHAFLMYTRFFINR